ncbi:hypothetical protein PR202_gb10870 [Eleusine coracana subsp. coracana]|uniref:Uncharacterized protein n=1 Tax=Eleusine coracana subsp. coracana TaxID=191504 RepID=A0AAV5EKE6_ELECO|nr:hypothetical protein PR202_gb10870 [Eleusine coracana subsp. coracana]
MPLILNHPEALNKARADIDATVGTSRLVSADDMTRLSYLKCVFTETLRLYPAAPLLLPHESRLARSEELMVWNLEVDMA